MAGVVAVHSHRFAVATDDDSGLRPAVIVFEHHALADRQFKQGMRRLLLMQKLQPVDDRIVQFDQLCFTQCVKVDPVHPGPPSRAIVTPKSDQCNADQQATHNIINQLSFGAATHSAPRTLKVVTGVASVTFRRLVGGLVEELHALKAEVATLRSENTALREDNAQLRLDNSRLKAENQQLRDEIARLKNLPPRPPFRPSGMEKATEPGNGDRAAGKAPRGPRSYLEDQVLHDAGHDIRTPTHELTIARDVLKTRRRIAAQPPGWALSANGLRSLRGQAWPAASVGAISVGGSNDCGLEVEAAGAGEAENNSNDDANPLDAEFAAIDAVLARSDAAIKQARAPSLAGARERDPLVYDRGWEGREARRMAQRP